MSCKFVLSLNNHPYSILMISTIAIFVTNYICRIFIGMLERQFKVIVYIYHRIHSIWHANSTNTFLHGSSTGLYNLPYVCSITSSHSHCRNVCNPCAFFAWCVCFCPTLTSNLVDLHYSTQQNPLQTRRWRTSTPICNRKHPVSPSCFKNRPYCFLHGPNSLPSSAVFVSIVFFTYFLFTCRTPPRTFCFALARTRTQQLSSPLLSQLHYNQQHHHPNYH